MRKLRLTGEQELSDQPTRLVDALPVHTPTLVALLRLFYGLSPPPDSIQQLVGQDAGLCAKVLCRAGLLSHDASHRPGGLRAALKVLGQDTLRSMVMREVSRQLTSRQISTDPQLSSLWQDSLALAATARALAAEFAYADSEEAHLSGLLHGLGRLSLLALPDLQEQAESHPQDNRHWRDHADLGADLIESWELDSFLADSVRYQTLDPQRLRYAHPLIRILRAAILLQAGDFAAARDLIPATTTDARLLAIVEQTQAQQAQLLRQLDPEGDGQDGVNPERMRDALAAALSDLAALSEARRNLAAARDVFGLASEITRTAGALFGFSRVLVFQLEANGRRLRGIPLGSDMRRFAELTIELVPGTPIADAALERTIIVTGPDDEHLGFIEQQLMRTLAASHLLCLPLRGPNALAGIAVAAMTADQVEGCKARLACLSGFGERAGMAMLTLVNRSAREESQQEQGTEALREAARRLAHEMNNPLTIVRNYLSVIERKTAGSEPLVKEVSILNEEIERVRQMVTDFAEQQPMRGPVWSNLNKAIADAVTLFRSSGYAPPAVRVTAQVYEGHLEVCAPANALRQILVNLVRNAVEAIKGGGDITVGTHGLVNRDGKLYADLWVHDTGEGIPPERMGQVFAPVNSSKGDSHKGIGLKIVHDLVKQADGFITCRSHAAGTTFEILLPARGPSTAQAPTLLENQDS